MTEDTQSAYRVHGSRFRYAMALLREHGIEPSEIMYQAPHYIIILPMPLNMDALMDAPRPRRRQFGWSIPPGIVWPLVILVSAGAIIYYAPQLLGGLAAGVADSIRFEMPAVNLWPWPGAEQAGAPAGGGWMQEVRDTATTVALVVVGVPAALLTMAILWKSRNVLAALGRGTVAAGKLLGKAAVAAGKPLGRVGAAAGRAAATAGRAAASSISKWRK